MKIFSSEMPKGILWDARPKCVNIMGCHAQMCEYYGMPVLNVGILWDARPKCRHIMRYQA